MWCKYFSDAFLYEFAFLSVLDVGLQNTLHISFVVSLILSRTEVFGSLRNR
jgi:hypothetical protein